jgi:hypothetical protein
MDYLSQEDVISIYAISAEDPNRIGIWASSTPTGRRSHFFDWCMSTQKGQIKVDQGKHVGKTWIQFYYPSSVGPFWNAEAEAEYRENFPGMGYVHEIEADFGDEMVGVFKKDDISAITRDYQYVNAPSYHALRTMGIDWDKYGNASQIVVIEFNPNEEKFQVINRVEIEQSERTLTVAVNKIAELDAIYNTAYIYADRGYGEMQIEYLTERLGTKVKGIAFGGKIDVLDPVTKLVDKKDVKPFMVNNAQIIVERHNLLINKNDKYLLKQMHDYVVEKITQSGRPIYTSVNEHALDAMMLALLAFTIEFPEVAAVIRRPQYAKALGVVSNPINSMGNKEDEEEVVTAIRSHVVKWGDRGRSNRPSRKALSRRRSF